MLPHTSRQVEGPVVASASTNLAIDVLQRGWGGWGWIRKDGSFKPVIILVSRIFDNPSLDDAEKEERSRYYEASP